jgi:hypothetical protein
VCENYATRDKRIRFVRQARNLNYGNFRFVLQQADTPFFMFAAGDDYWHQEYAARLIDALESSAAAVCPTRESHCLIERRMKPIEQTDG